MSSNSRSENLSALGRLLQELSWSSPRIREFRDGGLSQENVLTAKALQGLDFLPGSAFFGSVISAAQGAASARAQLVEDAETAEFTLLPGDVYIEASAASRKRRIAVQPDGIIVSPKSV